jgi:hypothetical protein
MAEKLVYSPEEYVDLDCGDYRNRFPTETKNLTDEQLFNVVAGTDDDMEDDEWRKLFWDAATVTVNTTA